MISWALDGLQAGHYPPLIDALSKPNLFEQIKNLCTCMGEESMFLQQNCMSKAPEGSSNFRGSGKHQLSSLAEAQRVVRARLKAQVYATLLGLDFASTLLGLDFASRKI